MEARLRFRVHQKDARNHFKHDSQALRHKHPKQNIFDGWPYVIGNDPRKCTQ